ncbi:hypothetical protein [Nocardia goodfellowii]|uniref:WXG100 family type VII secretion target n=1 Tax=Nocardia goodfellowii TaxID=882446 RepID=A0ABS4QL07_9NOCA|nr:hypothetical protein [Nocardia goodfellowii]MBP2192238.1 hypothetical protein [Nocardia goodfellowii]
MTVPDNVDWFPGSNVAQFILGGDLLSITGVVNQIIDLVTGWNAVESITSNFGGDWEGLRKSVDAVRNLAEYNIAYSAAVKASAAHFNSSWQGKAATSAIEYFDSLCTALENQAAALGKVAEEINTFAEASYLMIQAMNNIVQMIVDLAIILIATIAAYGTGVGAAASAVSAAITASMIAKVAAALKIIGESLVIAEGVMGLIITGLAASQGEDKYTELPTLGKSYNHSVV